MDVMVFNHRCQQRFGNITISLCVGGKVLLRNDFTTWLCLAGELECRVFEAKTMPDLAFDALIIMPGSDRKQNPQKAAVLLDCDWQRAMWERLYHV